MRRADRPRDGTVVAALNVGAHAARADAATLRRDVVPLLRRAADEIGAALGPRASWASPPAGSCDGPHRVMATSDATLQPVYFPDAVRTPFGRYGGALAGIRTDDLAAEPLRALQARNPSVDWGALDDVILGCANQAGEDNRNVARMALLLAGLPDRVPGATVNRLCASSLDACVTGARAVAAGEMSLVIAGGVESMSRAPFVMAKSAAAYARDLAWADTTLGWRFVNPRMQAQYGIDSMPETAEHVAAEHGIARADQDRFALRSQQRAEGGGRRTVRRRDRPDRRPSTEGPGARGRRRAPTAGDHPRVAREAQADRLPAARSRPATPRASTTAAMRCCWRRRPRCGRAWPDAPARATWPRRSRASRRASWASVRCPRSRSCSPAQA